MSISPNTLIKYIEILEALYIVFRVTPFSKNIARSLLKEPKIYFFDVGLVNGDLGAKFENLIACCLLKHVYAKIDYQAENYSLKYLQTKDRQEVDFALVKDKEIKSMIEVKLSNHSIHPGLSYFHKKYDLAAIQLVKDLKRQRIEGGIEILDADSFLVELDL